MVNQREKVIIIGAGMSGMAAAIAAARSGAEVLLLEKFNRPGKKLLATGNGRCNLMNLNPPVYFGDPSLASAVMGENPVQELTAFWDSLGLRLRYDAEGRGYPCTFQAATVLDCLTGEIKRLGVQLLTGQQVSALYRKGDRFLAETAQERHFSADRVILSTGGLAQPKLGGNQDAFPWLEQWGHHLLPPAPALTPLRTDRLSVSGLEGLRVRCRLTVMTEGESVHQEQGELLFAEQGISGICVMQCARYIQPGKSICVLDLFPDLFPEVSGLADELIRRQARMPLEAPPALLSGLCAPKMAYAICKQAGLPLRGETAGSLTEAQLTGIAQAARGYRVSVLGLEGFDRAQVTAGGLAGDEVWPDTLESRKCPGLHVTGELLNVDGDCGGFNLMFACMTGLKAGRNERMAER